MRALRAGLLLPLVLLVAAACGLPGTYYLEPPDTAGITQSTASNGEAFNLRTSSRAGDIAATFLGYEYYYKCFATEAEAIALLGYGSNNLYTDLTSAGFLRLCRGPNNGGLSENTSPDVTSLPLAPINVLDAGQIFTLSMRINDSAAPAPFGAGTYSYVIYTPPSGLPASPTAIEVRRFVAGSGTTAGHCKPFVSNADILDNWEDSPPDADVTAAMLSTIFSGDGDIYIVMYAVSYGRGDDASALRSYPVCLGYTRTHIAP